VSGRIGRAPSSVFDTSGEDTSTRAAVLRASSDLEERGVGSGTRGATRAGVGRGRGAALIATVDVARVAGTRGVTGVRGLLAATRVCVARPFAKVPRGRDGTGSVGRGPARVYRVARGLPTALGAEPARRGAPADDRAPPATPGRPRYDRDDARACPPEPEPLGRPAVALPAAAARGAARGRPPARLAPCASHDTTHRSATSTISAT
jgi:hypothetical protein